MPSERELSDQHERDVAKWYGGHPSRNSGAGTREKGDVLVKDDDTLFECKRKGRPGVAPKSQPRILSQMEDIAELAYDEGREPALALRFFAPNSPLANKQTGWVDFTVRLTHDDVQRAKEDLSWP